MTSTPSLLVYLNLLSLKVFKNIELKSTPRLFIELQYNKNLYKFYTRNCTNLQYYRRKWSLWNQKSQNSRCKVVIYEHPSKITIKLIVNQPNHPFIHLFYCAAILLPANQPASLPTTYPFFIPAIYLTIHALINCASMNSTSIYWTLGIILEAGNSTTKSPMVPTQKELTSRGGNQIYK